MSFSGYSVRGCSLVVNQHVLKFRFSLVPLTVRKIILISPTFVKAFEPVSHFLALNNSIVMESSAAEGKQTFSLHRTRLPSPVLNRGSGNAHITGLPVHGNAFHKLP